MVPLPSCIQPNIFHSTRVRNAIATIKGMIKRRRLIKNMYILRRGVEPDGKVSNLMQLPGSATLINPVLGRGALMNN